MKPPGSFPNCAITDRHRNGHKQRTKWYLNTTKKNCPIRAKHTKKMKEETGMEG